MRIPAFLAIVGTLLSFSCGGPVDVDPANTLDYISYDSSGTPLVRGWFTLKQDGPASISGEWHFRPIGTPQRIGPQVGDGVLVGGIQNGQVWVELNPQFKDHNLQLLGTLTGERFTGRWTWYSLVGATNGGFFQAVRRVSHEGAS